MKNFVICLVAFLYCSHLSHAQYSRLLHKNHSEQKEILSDLYYSANHGGITLDGLADTLAGMRQLGTREKDPNLLQEADLLEAFYKVFNRYEPIDMLIKVQQKSEEKGFQYMASRAANAISNFYWEEMEFEKSIRWHLLLEGLIQDMSIEEFPDKAIFLQQIGNDFLFFGDYTKAISYFRRVAELPLDEFYIYAYRHTFNNLGLSYREIGKLDSSDYYFEKLLIHADTTSDQWVGIASGNLGYNHFLKGELQEAIPFLEKDILLAEQFEDLGLAVGSCIPLAEIYIRQVDLTKARSYINKAIEYINRSGQTDRYAKLYPVMSKWEAAMNRPQLATAYLDSALIYQKRVNEKFSALQLMRANQEVMASRKDKEIQTLNDQAEKNKVIRNFIIGGLGFLLIGFVVVYRVREERNKAQQKLKTIALDKANLELENAQNLLKTYVQKINNNSKIIQSLEDSPPSEEQQGLIDELKLSTILTEADWDTFQRQFDKVFPNLIKDLVSKYPNLSPAELRFLLLTKLEMPTVQIANALGVSPASLRVTWFRIRKKLDLPKDFPFSSFFEKHFSEL
ncbi:Flp pilus assembly protein TadD, contains TPR repeats [Algoriphagus locisalis]|uniref:Flp pilus assembly protein TadD, contains TPR repeats n=1 Tax=Algoriphagus locisalis TaxID=305507 RepID=A0A1I7BCI3_9BACT|nr:hypothetical protein [Algoriphagus locisalis]SFT84920.1 Flp pilus assembly protein TadD, contains TPR repeats [Algoriphagus locisalis]